ncbi:hypothetical protein N8I74_03300 [Chitiniphilus purpureus]|uniref:Uncharacterized protein n=1 Tax=Chitiniphilus purpureus TaxID=2981137 RepID=A0ABY6DW38_9NEIS|nr:hypothetical protein [Chitiniphilus sp. CD1]UXY16063.1 hypothetical protein N8I74_03300 [Chitiniphilus sp. CD1]
MATCPSQRIAAVTLALTLEGELTDAGRERLLQAARHCKRHRSLSQPPDITLQSASALPR